MSMKRTYWIPPVILVIVFLIASLPVFARETEDQTISLMLQSIEQTGAKTEEIELRTTVDLGVVATTKDLLELASSWSSKLEVPVQTSVKREGSNYVYQVWETKEGISRDLRMIGVPQNDHFHTYLVVGLKGNRIHAQDLAELRDRITFLFKKASMIPQFSTCIRGMYSDKLGVDQQEDKLHAVLTALQAIEIERLQDETVLSISAYTEQWKPSITTGQHKMNVQVATHLDTHDSITRITVGTPIITAEY